MSKKQIVKMIIDELKKTDDCNFLVTVYLFVKKFNSKGGS